MKKNIIIGICAFLIIAILVACNLPVRSGKSVSSIHINSSTIRLESNMTKRLSVTVYPEDADKDGYKLVSENEFVALCEGDSVIAVNEGETCVYAVSIDKKVKSNKVKVVVSNNIFEVAAKIIMLSESAQNDLGELKGVEITAGKASQITETEITKIPDSFKPPVITEENAEDTVYVTKSGSKFHLSSCSSAKNSTPISRSKAVSDGKEPCQKCKP